MAVYLSGHLSVALESKTALSGFAPVQDKPKTTPSCPPPNLLLFSPGIQDLP
jgi:hypothetical protein